MSTKFPPTRPPDKSRGELIEEGEEEEPTKPNVDINLQPDGNQMGININGTIVNATRRSIDITIGRFSITISNRFGGGITTSTDLLPSSVMAVAILSVCTGKPLHVVTEDSSTSVTANLSLGKLIAINHTEL